MLLKHEQLIGLPVETVSGQLLGKIHGFVIQLETQAIFQYQIKPIGLTGFFAKDLLINHNQVVSINKEKMLVDDLVYKQIESETRLVNKKTVPQEVTAISAKN